MSSFALGCLVTILDCDVCSQLTTTIRPLVPENDRCFAYLSLPIGLIHQVLLVQSIQPVVTLRKARR